MPGVRLLTLNVRDVQDLRVSLGARLVQFRGGGSLEGGAAALRGTSGAAPRMLNDCFRGGRRTLDLTGRGAPEQANAADRE